MQRLTSELLRMVSLMEKMMEGMEGMMPHCLNIMMPVLPKEKRAEFALKMARALSEHGGAEMTDAESEVFLSELSAAIREGLQRSSGTWKQHSNNPA